MLKNSIAIFFFVCALVESSHANTLETKTEIPPSSPNILKDVSTEKAQTSRLSVNVSIPYLLTIERESPLTPQSSLEAFVGFLPISTLLFMDTQLTDIHYSSTHKISYSLSAKTYSSGLRYKRYLSQNFSIYSEIGILVVRAGANLHLKNRSNNTLMPFANVHGALVQPLFGVGIQKSWKSVALMLGVHVFKSPQVQMKSSGWFVSFKEVAPSYKSAIDDGTRAAERAIQSALSHLTVETNILPTLGISYRF